MEGGWPVSTNRATLQTHLRGFLEFGLMLDPWLAGLSAENFSFGGQELLARAAARLAAQHWHEPLIADTLGVLPAQRSLALRAAREILNSSAATVAQDRLGRIAVDAAMAGEAIERMDRFVDRHGFGPLVQIFLAVTACDSQAAVAHYGQLSEQEFVSGARHRPWANGSLGDELLAGLACGAYRLKVQDRRRIVVTTEAGRRRQAAVRGVLTDSGYLEARLRLAWISHANLLAEAEDPETGLWAPKAYRLALTRFSRAGPGMRVLDAGCGPGTQMFAGGLWEAVGRDGTVTGLDPAAALLDRARRKAQALHTGNVTLVQGRAESMPFADGQFDVSIAAGLLEYTDGVRAMAEVVRVTRPGGWVTVAGSTDAAFDGETLRDWFLPLAQIAKRYGIDAGARTAVYGRLAEVFENAGLRQVEIMHADSQRILSDPDRTVAELIQGSAFAQEVLERVPWAARHEVVRELVARGQALCATTAPEQRTVVGETHLARGAVVAPR
jgi:ubiquinone/menaquinone biosynthesis C-methylase UbiE